MYKKTQIIKLFDISLKNTTMDLITKLLTSKNSIKKVLYDLIIIIIEKLIKYIHFIPFKKILTLSS